MGVGAPPFLIVKDIGKRTIGWPNAAAAGLMLAEIATFFQGFIGGASTGFVFMQRTIGTG